MAEKAKELNKKRIWDNLEYLLENVFIFPEMNYRPGVVLPNDADSDRPNR